MSDSEDEITERQFKVNSLLLKKCEKLWLNKINSKKAKEDMKYLF